MTTENEHAVQPSENFYRDLKSFSDFQKLNEVRHYSSLPADWSVVITDVRGSTKAIEQGRYQEVNTLGAASVAVLGKLWRQDEVPFVFGGDGASLLVPPSKLKAVTDTLVRLRNLAKANYDLELRIGVVPMTDIAASGLQIDVAKFSVPGTKAIAFIRGGGLSWADTKIKSDSEKYCLSDESVGAIEELTDLSCRWQPLKSRKGRILSILVRPVSNDLHIFTEVLDRLAEILGGDVQHSNPANVDTMTYKSYWQTFKTEFKYHRDHLRKSYYTRLFWSAFSTWSIKGNRTSPFDAQRYVKQIPSHSDFRKFDDMLRLVIDCDPDQVQKIRAYLEALYREEKVFFGIHESDHAIMTCLVGSVDDGNHIHFIDGGEGGYALAAKGLKEQMSLANSQSGKTSA